MAKDGNKDLKPVPITGTGKDNLFSPAEFQQLAEVPQEIERFANLGNPRTKRAYILDLQDFIDLVGIGRPEEFRMVSRSHVIAWRSSLEQRELGGATIHRKLAALTSFSSIRAIKTP